MKYGASRSADLERALDQSVVGATAHKGDQYDMPNTLNTSAQSEFAVPCSRCCPYVAEISVRI